MPKRTQTVKSPRAIFPVCSGFVSRGLLQYQTTADRRNVRIMDIATSQGVCTPRYIRENPMSRMRKKKRNFQLFFFAANPRVEKKSSAALGMSAGAGVTGSACQSGRDGVKIRVQNPGTGDAECDL